MLKQDIEEYVKRNVVLITKKGWKYQGKIISLTESCVVIDDRFIGKTKIDIFAVSTINNDRDK